MEIWPTGKDILSVKHSCRFKIFHLIYLEMIAVILMMSSKLLNMIIVLNLIPAAAVIVKKR